MQHPVQRCPLPTSNYYESRSPFLPPDLRSLPLNHPFATHFGQISSGNFQPFDASIFLASSAVRLTAVCHRPHFVHVALSVVPIISSAENNRCGPRPLSQ